MSSKSRSCPFLPRGRCSRQDFKPNKSIKNSDFFHTSIGPSSIMNNSNELSDSDGDDTIVSGFTQTLSVLAQETLREEIKKQHTTAKNDSYLEKSNQSSNSRCRQRRTSHSSKKKTASKRSSPRKYSNSDSGYSLSTEEKNTEGSSVKGDSQKKIRPANDHNCNTRRGSSNLHERKHSASELEIPIFDPKKFKPDFLPSIVKNGDEEYAIVVTGVRDTGLCGKYWGDLLPPKRRSTVAKDPQVPNEITNFKGVALDLKLKMKKSSKKSGGRSNKISWPNASVSHSNSSSSIVSPDMESNTLSSISQTPFKPMEERFSSKYTQTNGFDILESIRRRVSLNDVGQSALLQKGGGSLSEVTSLASQLSESPQKGVRISSSEHHFAPYESYHWVNVGRGEEKNRSVLFSRALMVQNHLLSFLRIKEYSQKDFSDTKSNNVVFVVLEGDVSVILHSMSHSFMAQKGDSFHVPPGVVYTLSNEKIREVELILFQFQSNK